MTDLIKGLMLSDVDATSSPFSSSRSWILSSRRAISFRSPSSRENHAEDAAFSYSNTRIALSRLQTSWAEQLTSPEKYVINKLYRFSIGTSML
jgi:hypothetical protein